MADLRLLKGTVTTLFATILKNYKSRVTFEQIPRDTLIGNNNYTFFILNYVPNIISFSDILLSEGR